MTIVHSWLFLLGAVLFEVAGTSVMKLSQSAWPLAGMVAMYLLLGLSYFCLAKAAVRIPIGVAYAFWEGLGLLLITLVSVLFLGELINAVRALALLLVFTGTLLVHHGTEASAAPAAPAASPAGGAPC